MWTAQEHDAVLQRISALGDAEDGSDEQREMLGLAEKWNHEGGVPEGGCATLDERTHRRALIVLQALAWLRHRVIAMKTLKEKVTGRLKKGSSHDYSQLAVSRGRHRGCRKGRSVSRLQRVSESAAVVHRIRAAARPDSDGTEPRQN